MSSEILDVIARRKSVRSYADERVDAAMLDQVMEAAERAESLTEAEVTMFLDHDGSVVEGGLVGLLGDYGKVIHAPHYLVIAIDDEPGYLLDAGYRLEQGVLEATRVGLGTCWVGGFFREAAIAPHLSLSPRARVVALTPLGYKVPPRGARGLLQRAMRVAVRSVSRKPVEELFFWQRYGEPLPERVLQEPKMVQWIEAIRRAPSWANRQPWRFVLDAQRVYVLKARCQLKEGKDYHFVDCGIAMSHLHLAAEALGFGGQWQLSPQSDLDLPAKVELLARYDFEALPGA